MRFIDKLKDLRFSLRRIRQLQNDVSQLNARLSSIEQRLLAQQRQIQFNYHALLPSDQYPEELKKWYFNRTGKRLNLDNPKTYNEKIQWFKLYGVTPQIRDLCDKYRVRSYVASKIGEEYLVPLIGMWKYPEEIDFSALPDKFVIKANHGCKYNYIVTD